MASALVRVRYAGGFTGHLGRGVRGVVLVDGEATNGITLDEATRLVGIGVPLEIVGPWDDVALAVTLPPPAGPPATLEEYDALDAAGIAPAPPSFAPSPVAPTSKARKR